MIKLIGGTAAALAMALLSGSVAQAGTTVVTPANFIPGVTAWEPTDVTSGGTANISGANPRSGNGSLELSMAAGGDKATAIHYGGNGLSLSDIVTNSANNLGFDYYRSSSSTANNIDAPAYRLYVGQFSTQLVWEAAYNGVTGSSPVPTDSWQSVDIKSGQFWERTGGQNYNAANQTKTLSQWLSDPTITGGSGMILDYSVGVGSGWGGSYKGYVDNVKFGTDTANFETAAVAPEPSSFAVFGMIGLGLGALILRARRRPQSSS